MPAPPVRITAARKLALLCILLLPCVAIAEPPPLGLTARARIDRVVDGDTVDVVIEIPVRVRLLDCWAPEIRGAEKELGEASKAHLQSLAPVGSDVTLHVPSGDARSMVDVLTFGRILGHLWVSDDDETLSAQQVEAGHATEAKE